MIKQNLKYHQNLEDLLLFMNYQKKIIGEIIWKEEMELFIGQVMVYIILKKIKRKLKQYIIIKKQFNENDENKDNNITDINQTNELILKELNKLKINYNQNKEDVLELNDKVLLMYLDIKNIRYISQYE